RPRRTDRDIRQSETREDSGQDHLGAGCRRADLCRLSSVCGIDTSENEDTYFFRARKRPIMNVPKPAVGMLPNERLAYSAIPNRKPLKLPSGARMVVWTVTNVEDWDPTQTMPRTVLTPPAGGSPMPDIPNWCWHEYGNRVGFWRL